MTGEEIRRSAGLRVAMQVCMARARPSTDVRPGAARELQPLPARPPLRE